MRIGHPGVVVIAVLMLVAAPPMLTAQDEYEFSPMAEAARLLRAGDWQGAAEICEDITSRQPDNGTAWIQLGIARHQMRQYRKALIAWQHAEVVASTRVLARYNLACAHSLLGEKAAALGWLNAAIQAGFDNVQLLQTDTDLDILRDEPRFTELLTAADRNARPCEHDPKCSELDFWIGEWDVFNVRGVLVGNNTITKQMEGCMLLERWRSAYSPAGTSMSFYDHNSNRWRQQWIGAGRSFVSYEGVLENGAMRLRGESINRDGSKQYSRMVLTPREDGTVHQLIEQSDDGRIWSVFFEGVYVPHVEDSTAQSQP